MIMKHEIHVDLLQRGCDPIIQISQGDAGSHEILFWITKNRRRWRPPAGLSVLVHYSNSFDSGGTYDTLPDGSPAWKLGRDCLSVALVPEMMALPGSVHVVVTLLHGGKALSAFHVQLMVKGLASATSPVLTNYTNITGFLPAPDSAEEGQFFTAETVTDSGRVARVAAVDVPTSSGDIDSSMLPTATVDVTDNGAKITLSDKNGTTTATISNGQDGITPHIGDNGNWFLDKEDTGKASQGAQGPQGAAGKTAYEYAREGGYTGTEEAFAQKLASEGYGYVAQEEPPKDTNLLWLDTNDDSADISSGNVKADWNAAEGESGHVLNRTHWTEEKNTVFIDNVTVDPANPVFTDLILVAGREYNVVYNGVSYTDIAFSAVLSGMHVVSIGNGAMLGLEGIGEDRPYSFLYVDGMGTQVADLTGAESIVLTVSGIETVVHQLPEKYIPDMRPYYVLLFTTNGIDFMTTQASKNLEQAYNSGRQIILKMQVGEEGYFLIPLSAIQSDLREFVFANQDYNFSLRKNDIGGYDVTNNI